ALFPLRNDKHGAGTSGGYVVQSMTLRCLKLPFHLLSTCPFARMCQGRCMGSGAIRVNRHVSPWVFSAPLDMNTDRVVEDTGGVSEEDDRGFQPLGLMQVHDANHAIAL